MHSATAPRLQKPQLQLGASGPDVEELQTLLMGYYPLIGQQRVLPMLTPGVFNAETELVVEQFQYQFFMEANGIVGNRTWRVLYSGQPVDMPVLRYGDTGDDIVTVQHMLSHLGYYDEVIDGTFEVHTDAAVRAFQRASGLVDDGIVGEQTWYGLSRHARPST